MFLMLMLRVVHKGEILGKPLNQVLLRDESLVILGGRGGGFGVQRVCSCMNLHELDPLIE